VDDLLKAVVKQMMGHNNIARCNTNSRGAIGPSAASSTTTVFNIPNPCNLDRLPSLTAAKCALLMDHEGCFKCCVFYTAHKSTNFPDGFPDKTSYIPLTEASMLLAKKKQIKKEKTPAAAVVVPTAIVMPSAVLGNGSDSKYVYAPFFVPHFFFDCTVGGSMVCATCVTMIHMVF
jgi:hypothetical protein